MNLSHALPVCLAGALIAALSLHFVAALALLAVAFALWAWESPLTALCALLLGIADE